MPQNKDAEIYFFSKKFKEGHYYGTSNPNTLNYIISKLKSVDIKGKILEIGCGSGTIGRELIEEFPGIKITGVEIVKEMVDNINRSKNPKYKAICADIEKKSIFRESSFDSILSFNILHHFSDPSKLFENIGHWLKPNGSLIIIEPNGSNPVNILINIRRKLIKNVFSGNLSMNLLNSTPNETFHSVRTYRRLAKKNSFRFKQADGYNSYLNSKDPLRSSIFKVTSSLFGEKYSNNMIFFALEKKHN